jgi:hypothetical protein
VSGVAPGGSHTGVGGCVGGGGRGHGVGGGGRGGHMGDSLDGVGEGLVNDGLVDGLVGGDGSGDGDGGVHGHVLEDGLGHVVGAHNRRGLVRGNGCGDVGVRRLSDGVRQRRDLGRHGGESVRLGGGVGEVAAEAVVLDGGGVVGGCADQVTGGGGQGKAGRGHKGAGPGEGEQGCEEQEGLRNGKKLKIKMFFFNIF